MVKPFRDTQISLALRKKIASHLAIKYSTTDAIALKFVPSTVSECGKLKILDGGDLIDSCSFSRNTARGRDKSFVKYTLEVDRNARYRNRPVALEERSYYGQVNHFVVLSLPSTCPFIQANPTHAAERPSSVIMAAIAPIKQPSVNELGMSSYTALEPIK
ncbi:hypothetical protein BD779DRAFT_1720377 [Infundibulicybe gibba]|nr:hypothetical protein BD779DRAFT_1720377 [Infundibulicybe gibba]